MKQISHVEYKLFKRRLMFKIKLLMGLFVLYTLFIILDCLFAPTGNMPIVISWAQGTVALSLMLLCLSIAKNAYHSYEHSAINTIPNSIGVSFSLETYLDGYYQAEVAKVIKDLQTLLLSNDAINFIVSEDGVNTIYELMGDANNELAFQSLDIPVESGSVLHSILVTGANWEKHRYEVDLGNPFYD